MVDLGPVDLVHKRSMDPGCPHEAAVEVRAALTDELVAWWCPDCERQLPGDWTRTLTRYGELLHQAGVGIAVPVAAILNPATGEYVPVDPPLYVAPRDIDRVVAEHQTRFLAEWEAGLMESEPRDE
jgi:hypothetical protein